MLSFNVGGTSLVFLVPSCLTCYMLGCVVYGEFHLGPRSLHGDFFCFKDLKRANLASSPREEFIEFSALFIRGTAGDFW